MTEFQALNIANEYGEILGGGPSPTWVAFTGEELLQFVSAILATRDAALTNHERIELYELRDADTRLSDDARPAAITEGPLKRLGARLAALLDEDQFNSIEPLLNACLPMRDTE